MLLTKALEYLNKGWSVIPLKPMSKEPAIYSWSEFQHRLPTVDEVSRWFGENPYNLGIVTGRNSNLVVVDIDGQAGSQSAKTLGIDLTSSAVVKTARGYHCYYKHPGANVRNTVKSLPGIDIRGDGGYVVAPPSVTVSGTPYFWISQTDELPVYQEFTRERSKVVSSLVPSDAIAQGQRNSHLTSLAGSMRRRDMSAGAIFAALQLENQLRCKPPLPDSEVKTIADSVSRYAPEERGCDKPSVSVVGLDELLCNSASPEWVVNGLIPEQSIAIIGGMQGIGKTWLLLDLAIELSRSGKWLGKYPTTRRKVLYLDEESSPPLLRSRLSKLVNEKQLENSDIDVSFSIGSNINFLDPVSLQQLEMILDDVQPEVVFVDSLVRVHTASENSSTEMSQFFKVVKNLVRKYKLTFIFADHETKSVYHAENAGVAPSSNDLRGSNEKAAAADSVFSLRMTKDGMYLYHTKSRFCEAALPAMVRIEDSGDEKTAVKAY